MDDRIVYHPAVWKAWVELLSALAVALGLLVAWGMGRPPLGWLGGGFSAAILASLTWDAVRALFGRRTLTFSRDGVSLSTWGRTSFIPWPEVRAISVFAERGAAMLQIIGVGSRQGSLTWGWNENAYDIVDDVQALRARWAGQAGANGATVVDRAGTRRRNHARWIGMALALLADVLVGLALMIKDIREKGPSERPPGVDFQWAVAPSPLQIGLFVLAMILAAVGMLWWLWPRAVRARPPIFATLPEYLLFGMTLLVQGMSADMVLTWLAHPPGA